MQSQIHKSQIQSLYHVKFNLVYKLEPVSRHI